MVLYQRTCKAWVDARFLNFCFGILTNQLTQIKHPLSLTCSDKRNVNELFCQQ